MHQILIVEDDPALSQGIRLALGQEGRQFVQAGTIGQAERELAERTFDLLILDGERGRGALREYASEQTPEPDKPQ